MKSNTHTKIDLAWKRVGLGDLITEVKSGISIEGSKEAAYEGQSGILRLSALSDGKLYPDRNKAVDVDEIDVEPVRVKAGSILITRANTKDLVGMCGYVDKDYDNLFIPDLIWQLSINKEVVEPLWLCMYLSSPMGRAKLTSIAAGSNASMVKINKAGLRKIDLLLPALSEQRRIVAILSQWDDSLSILAQLIDAKRQQKRGLAEQLLTGKRRLLGFEDDWSAHPLGFLLLSKLKVRAGGADYPILSVTVDGVKLQGDHFNKRIASENSSDYLVVERGEIAMSGLNFWMGAVGMQSIVDTGVISPAYKVFKVNGQLMNSDYAMHFVRSETMLSILLESSVQGASVVRRNLDMKALTSAPVRLPSLLEQQAIATVLSTLDSEIAALEALKAKVAEQKRGLMDALLTGRVRVNVEDAS